VNDAGGVFRYHSVEARTGDEPIDEFVHVPLTIPALRRVAIILNAATAEHKRLARRAVMIRSLRCAAATLALRRFGGGQSRLLAL
jgi:hypothetical protein